MFRRVGGFPETHDGKGGTFAARTSYSRGLNAPQLERERVAAQCQRLTQYEQEIAHGSPTAGRLSRFIAYPA